MDYRVYDKKRKRWLNEDVYLTQNGELLKPNKSIFGWTKPTFISEDRYVYQKYIELNDKNGTPVYVGDYLEAKVAEDRIVRGLVTFANELSAYIILCFDSDEFFSLGSDICQYIEVVGNVFDEEKKERKNGKQSLQK